MLQVQATEGEECQFLFEKPGAVAMNTSSIPSQEVAIPEKSEMRIPKARGKFLQRNWDDVIFFFGGGSGSPTKMGGS